MGGGERRTAARTTRIHAGRLNRRGGPFPRSFALLAGSDKGRGSGSRTLRSRRSVLEGEGLSHAHASRSHVSGDSVGARSKGGGRTFRALPHPAFLICTTPILRAPFAGRGRGGWQIAQAERGCHRRTYSILIFLYFIRIYSVKYSCLSSYH